MTLSDNLEGLALELRAALPEPSVDYAAQRRRLAADPRASSTSRPWLPAFAVALAFATALVAIGAWRLMPARQSSTAQLALASAAGHRHADGSFVALEPGGLGRVLESSNQDLRYELVSGRAEVSVVPLVGHHWSVSAGPYTVKVIGTAFHVEFTPPGALRVAVEHGIVTVSGGKLGSEVRLEQGARLQVEGETVSIDRGSAAEAPPAEPAPGSVSAPGSNAARDALDKKPSEDWEALYGKSDYRKAVAQARAAGFENLVYTLPEAKLSKLADAARLGGDENGARLALQSLAHRFPRGAGAPRAVFLLGTMDAKAGNATGAVSSFQRYLSLAPNGPFASEAMGRLMQLYSQRGQVQEGRQMASSYLQREPSGPYARLAQSLTKAP